MEQKMSGITWTTTKYALPSPELSSILAYSNSKVVILEINGRVGDADITWVDKTNTERSFTHWAPINTPSERSGEKGWDGVEDLWKYQRRYSLERPKSDGIIRVTGGTGSICIPNLGKTE